jgi:ABC-type uncharacterized transport system permease subunit
MKNADFDKVILALYFKRITQRFTEKKLSFTEKKGKINKLTFSVLASWRLKSYALRHIKKRANNKLMNIQQITDIIPLRF